MKRTWSVILLLALLAACESPTAWGTDVVVEAQLAEDVADLATVEGATGGIVVTGVYRIPSPGYTLRAYYQRRADEVTLFVGADPPSGIDLAVISARTYRVAILISAGTYSVRVVHRDLSTGNPEPREVADAEVTVSRN